MIDAAETQPESEPDAATHLLLADDAVTEGYRYGTYVTLCGELVPTSGLASSFCPPECDLEHPLCPECVREAAR